MFFIFVDLKNAFDWVPREVICFALKQKGVPEYLVNRVMSLYKGCKTAVSVDGELSSSFSVQTLCQSRVCFGSTFIYHGNERFECFFVFIIAA